MGIILLAWYVLVHMNVEQDWRTKKATTFMLRTILSILSMFFITSSIMGLINFYHCSMIEKNILILIFMFDSAILYTIVLSIIVLFLIKMGELFSTKWIALLKKANKELEN